MKPIFKCFPLIGVDFAHNPSSPYHLGEVRSVPCYKYARRQYLARASLARPNTSFVYPRTPWVIRDHSPFAQTRQLVSRMWKSVFVQVHPLSSCVYSRPAQLSWLICMTSLRFTLMTRPALYNTLPPFFIFSLLTTVEPCPMFHFHVCANRTNPDIFDPFGLIQIVTWFSLTPIVSSPLKKLVFFKSKE